MEKIYIHWVMMEIPHIIEKTYRYPSNGYMVSKAHRNMNHHHSHLNKGPTRMNPLNSKLNNDKRK